MAQLPEDVLKLILEPLYDSECCVFLRLVCKRWNALIRYKKYSKSQVISYYARAGSFYALEEIRIFLK